MDNQRSTKPELAASVYEFADVITQLWYYSERRWCDAILDDPLPDRVDVLVGRTLEIAERLAHPSVAVGAPADALISIVKTAWDHYKAAWQGLEHRRAAESVHEVDSEFRFEQERLALAKSPLVGPGWTKLRRGIVALQDVLPPILRCCFDTSTLLAAELYPTDERNQRVEKLAMSERRYLTVTLNQQLGHLMGTLIQAFPHLRGLVWELAGETEIRAMKKINRLHRAIPLRLKNAPDTNAAPCATVTENAGQQRTGAKTGDTDGTLGFIPGGFVYRGVKHDLRGKPHQVLETLYQARDQTMTLSGLQDKVWADQGVGEETVRSAVKVARRALRAAMDAASRDPKNPIPTVDRGSGRTAWRLDLS